MSLYPLFVTMYFEFPSRCDVISREVNKHTTTTGHKPQNRDKNESVNSAGQVLLEILQLSDIVKRPY